MTSEYKKELTEKLKELSLIELLNLLLNEDKPETKKFIKIFISENFQENPSLELEKSLKEINEGHYPQGVKERLVIAKTCAMDIKEHLEIEHTNSLAEISLLVSGIIDKSTVLSEL